MTPGRARVPMSERALALLRVAAGAVLLAFGVAKFTSHESELASFENYGLPAPDAFTYAIGVLEVGGGLLLLVGFLTRLAALALAGDMAGAIVVSGFGEGEAISLTLAPALLVTMIVLMRFGPGRPALRPSRPADGARLAR
jgi:putative oxidoreductase